MTPSDRYDPRTTLRVWAPILLVVGALQIVAGIVGFARGNGSAGVGFALTGGILVGLALWFRRRDEQR